MKILTLTPDLARRIRTAMTSPQASGIERGGWISKNGKVGGGYSKTGFITIDFDLDGEGEISHEFEADSQPKRWLDCWQETKSYLDNIIEDN